MNNQNSPPEPEKRLSPKQRAAALLLASGSTIDAAAKKVGCSESSIDHWKHNEAFLDAVRTAEDEIYSDALKLLKRTAKAAIMTLVSCLDIKVSDYVRVQAAAKLLDKAIDVHSIEQHEERLAELEALAKENQDTSI